MTVIGIDEVGRGALAGPVSVGSFLLFSEHSRKIRAGAKRRKLKFADSKKLTKRAREEWFSFLSEMHDAGYCKFVISHTAPQVIDKAGLTKAIFKALSRGLKKLSVDASETHVRLDGGLKAPLLYVHQKTIIKGDEKEFSIMCASIVAKVTRDRLMRKIAKKYANYGFDAHVGYGTKAHKANLEKYGKSPIHRVRFLKSFPTLV
jgi:ribonuclease HII